jgi:FMN hydrolase / 5-amino-6-(5-phospho-D-ribitylamino)uracil phosphatase
MMVPAVLSFDLDDTLWPVAPLMAAAESAMWSWLHARHPENHGISIASMRAMRARLVEQYPERSHDMTFLRHRALADMFAAAGHAKSEADEAFEVFFAERNRVTLYEDVKASLERLGSRYRLFALSNGNADLQRCGLAHLFQGHITAIAAGAAKPDARIFAHLLKEAGVEARQVLHIGDDPHADIVGATQAGLQAVWINRDAKLWPAEFALPARTISTLVEID